MTTIEENIKLLNSPTYSRLRTLLESRYGVTENVRDAVVLVFNKARRELKDVRERS